MPPKTDTNLKNKTYTLSIRLTAEEEAMLEEASAGMSKSDYGRLCIFGEKTKPRRTRGKHPVKDHKALSKVLAMLGASRIPNNLNQLAKAVHTGALVLSPEVKTTLLNACADIREIKEMLIKALGLGL